MNVLRFGVSRELCARLWCAAPQARYRHRSGAQLLDQRGQFGFLLQPEAWGVAGPLWYDVPVGPKQTYPDFVIILRACQPVLSSPARAI